MKPRTIAAPNAAATVAISVASWDMVVLLRTGGETGARPRSDQVDEKEEVERCDGRGHSAERELPARSAGMGTVRLGRNGTMNENRRGAALRRAGVAGTADERRGGDGLGEEGTGRDRAVGRVAEQRRRHDCQRQRDDQRQRTATGSDHARMVTRNAASASVAAPALAVVLRGRAGGARVGAPSIRGSRCALLRRIALLVAQQ